MAVFSILTHSFTGSVTLFCLLVCALAICNCHGEVKRNAFVTNPIPLASRSPSVCVLCARGSLACVHVRFLALAIATESDPRQRQQSV